MNTVLFLVLAICCIELLILLFFASFVYSEVKKIRKEVEDIKYPFYQMNTTLLHRASKQTMMNKHLALIGSKLAPNRYRTAKHSDKINKIREYSRK